MEIEAQCDVRSMPDVGVAIAIALYCMDLLVDYRISEPVHEMVGLPGFKANNEMEHFMGYQIDFNGAVTPELGQLLHSVQRQLHLNGMRVQVGAADTASGASTSEDCILTKTCPDTHPGHGPDIVIAIVAFVIGIVVGYFIGKRSATAAVKA